MVTKTNVMYRQLQALTMLLLLFGMAACSKRTHPAAATALPGTETAPAKRPVVKTAVPKVIVVNDKYAKRSVDGRYYYDLDGHRYWRNNKDGKYYLFNRSMYNDDAFKGPGNL